MRVVRILGSVIVALGAVVGVVYLATRPPSGGTTDGAGPERGESPLALTGSWPMFRGDPSLRGVTTARLPESLSLWWRFETKGSVKSSAAVQGGRVYVGSEDGTVYALDLSSGKKIWSFATEDAVEASPLVLAGTVYVGSLDCHLYAIRDGELLWKYETDDKIVGGANWVKAPSGDATWILAGSYDNMLHCVDAATGKAVWTYETDYFVNGAPGVAGGKAVFGGCDAIIHVVSVADGKRLAAIDAGAYIAASAAVVDDRAYVGNYEAMVLCVDISTEARPPAADQKEPAGGERIVWSYKDRDDPILSSPAVGDSQVIFGSGDYRVHCLSRDNGKPLWTFATRGEVDSSPVICGAKVVVGSVDGRLYLLRLQDGKKLWSYDTGEAITASPAVVNGMVVVGSEDGWIYAFGAPRQKEQRGAGIR